MARMMATGGSVQNEQKQAKLRLASVAGRGRGSAAPDRGLKATAGAALKALQGSFRTRGSGAPRVSPQARAAGDLARALKSTPSAGPKWMTPKAKNKFARNLKSQARWGNTPRRI